MGYVEQAALAADATFRSRIRIAAVRTAVLVRGQAPPDADSDFALREAFKSRQQMALNIIMNPDYLTETLSWVLASDPSLTSAVTDAALQTQVNNILINLTRWN